VVDGRGAVERLPVTPGPRAWQRFTLCTNALDITHAKAKSRWATVLVSLGTHRSTYTCTSRRSCSLTRDGRQSFEQLPAPAPSSWTPYRIPDRDVKGTPTSASRLARALKNSGVDPNTLTGSRVFLLVRKSP